MSTFDVTQFSTFTYKGKPCVPFCCFCERIRDINGKWHQIEVPEGIELSHSYCLECAKKHYPKLRFKEGSDKNG